MTAFSDEAAKREQRFGELFRIEGICPTSGVPYSFCSARPDYADATYLDWVSADSPPSAASERCTSLGGVPESGELSLELVDRDGALTALLTANPPPITRLSADCTAATTTLTVDSSAALSVGDLLYIGTECMTIGGIAGPTLTVARGKALTDAVVHKVDDLVYKATPFVRGRRIFRYFFPLGGASSADEVLVETYFIDSKGLSADYAGYVLTAKTLNQALGRLVGAKKHGTLYVSDVIAGPRLLLFMPNTNDVPGYEWSGTDPYSRFTGMFTPWPDGQGYALDDATGQVIGLNAITNAATVGQLYTRGEAGTQGADVAIDTTLRPVWLAATTNGAYRYSPGPSPSTDRSSGTWISTAHFVDITLCFLTSSASRDDGLELTNYDNTYGNWSSLSRGLGIGWPASLIDWPSFLAVKKRYPDAIFENFYAGHEVVTLAELLSKNFLEPLGCYLSFSSGKLRMIMPRTPLDGEMGTTWDDDVILARDGEDPSVRLPELGTVRQPTELLHSAIIITCRSSTGAKVQTTFTVLDYPSLFGATRYLGISDSVLRIDIPGLRADAAGVASFIEKIALRLLFRLAVPTWEMQPVTTLSQWAVSIGDVVALTTAALPDESTGLKGWTARPIEIREKVATMTPEHVGYRWVVNSLPNIRVGRIPPAGIVSSWSGLGPYTINFASHRYCEADADQSGLGQPTNDARGFEVGDVLRLRGLDGAAVGTSSLTQTVTSIDSDTTIKIDGNFGGALANGTILVFANETAAEADDFARFVFWGSNATNEIGTRATTAWQFSEA